MNIWTPRRTSIRRPIGGLRRRAFLGGGAAVVGLPFLESLEPRAARAQAQAAVRLIYIFVPNGLEMNTFRPAETGAGYTMPPMLLPLEPYRDSFSVVTQLENFPGNPDDQGDHAAGTSAFITCAHANYSETEIRLGISADQVAAGAIGNLTRLPSMQLGTEAGGTSGNCDSGYSCAYARNITWANETTPLPKVTDPQQVFDSIFAGFDPNATDVEQAQRQALETSVLDAALEDATLLEPRLGATDRGKLQQYLDGVRELERRAGSTTELTCAQGEPPASGRNLAYDQHIQTMNDLMVLALQCDATRIISFMFTNAISGKTHPWLDVNDGHHDVSHHQRDEGKIAQLARIGVWEMEQLAYLLGKLNDIPDGPDGSTLLYNSAIFLSSDVSDGNSHNHDDMPIILAGHGGGALNPGSHITYPSGANSEKEKVSNLLVTMLAAAGVDGSVGDSTGQLAEI